MTPLDFAKLFDAVTADLVHSLTAVAGTRLSNYTDWFSEKFISKISRQSNLHLHREGRPAKIDYVLSQDDQVPYRLDIAIEHEKNGASSTEEIAKFAALNARLSVLVTYINECSEDSYLARYQETLRLLDALDDFGSEKQLLVIIGGHDPWKPISIQNKISWNFYSFQKRNWKSLEFSRRSQQDRRGIFLSDGTCPVCGHSDMRLNVLDLWECTHCHLVCANVDGLIATVMPFRGRGEYCSSAGVPADFTGVGFAKAKGHTTLPDMDGIFSSRGEISTYAAEIFPYSR